MKLTRRTMIAGGFAGALAVPTLAGLARFRWQHGSQSGLVHDDSLVAGRRFAAASDAAGRPSVTVEGDTIRFARELVAAQPALIAGVTRHADALLIAEVAAEAGYILAAELRGNAAGCTGNTCHSGWIALTRMAVNAKENWAEAFANWAANPQSTSMPLLPRAQAARAGEMALGWLLVPRS